MTIDEAIKLLSLTPLTGDKAMNKEMKQAFNLGIEALKAYQKALEAGWYPPGYKLPGETEE